jgi:hypothetical protein
MIKYMLAIDSVIDRETGGWIPMVEGNHHYHEYQEWLAEGNTPVPMQPSPDHDLVDDEWVLNADKLKARETAEAAQALLAQTLDFRLLLVDVVTSLLASGRLKIDELPAETQAILADLQAKKDDYKVKKDASGLMLAGKK